MTGGCCLYTLTIMKAKTHYNQAYMFFCYNDEQGNKHFSSWEAAKKELGKEPIFLTSWLHSNWFNHNERVNEKILYCKPTVKQIRKFILESKKCLTK